MQIRQKIKKPSEQSSKIKNYMSNSIVPLRNWGRSKLSSKLDDLSNILIKFHNSIWLILKKKARKLQNKFSGPSMNLPSRLDPSNCWLFSTYKRDYLLLSLTVICNFMNLRTPSYWSNNTSAGLIDFHNTKYLSSLLTLSSWTSGSINKNGVLKNPTLKLNFFFPLKSCKLPLHHLKC